MSLPDWERNGWLTRHQTSPNEVRDLLQVVERDLADSAAEGLSADWRMNIGYNAVLQAAPVALAVAGYRAARDSHHYRAIQSLTETVGTKTSVIATFDAFRKKRNIAGYERIGLVSDTDADAMRTLALTLRDDVVAWLRSHHRPLFPK